MMKTKVPLLIDIDIEDFAIALGMASREIAIEAISIIDEEQRDPEFTNLAIVTLMDGLALDFAEHPYSLTILAEAKKQILMLKGKE